MEIFCYFNLGRINGEYHDLNQAASRQSIGFNFPTALSAVRISEGKHQSFLQECRLAGQAANIRIGFTNKNFYCSGSYPVFSITA